MIRYSRRRGELPRSLRTCRAVEPVVRRAMESLEQRTLMTLMAAAPGTPDNPILHRLLTQSDQDFFQPLGAVPVDSSARSLLHPNIYTPFNVDLTDLKSELSNAPLEFTSGANDPLVIQLPRPDGTLESFNIVEAPIMEAGLAAKFPDIKTFRGQGIDNPLASVRLDYTPLGFHAQVLAPDSQSYYIDPYFHIKSDGAYASYFKHDLAPENSIWECTTDDLEADGLHVDGGGLVDAAPPSLTQGTQLRTYRLACAATGEYTAFFGGTVAAGQAAIVSAINRVTGVYEAELDVRLVLVANNSNVVYTNSASDPYTNSNGATMLGQNQSNLDNVANIGSANYDIGHVFSTGGGGVASLGVVCVNGLKARGVTGNPSPTGDGFWIDYVAHEMGHQFGANHTFNSSTANCGGGNRSGTHAYEPGSGTTIMAYAGICGADDLQPHSDPYFVADSLDAINAFINSGSGSAVSPTATGNLAPTVSAGSDYKIPASTPFALTASGSDPDGDPITFEWQEHDLGPSLTLASADNGSSPMFRDWVPTSSPTRVLPKLSTVLAGSLNTVVSGSNVSERTFTVARTSTWRVVARDNKSGGGGLSTDDMILTVVNTGAGFAVTSPNTAVSWGGGTNQTVTWNVAGTTGAGINAANVKISLSTDGGNTFPTVLAASTANDGSESVTLPNINTSSARIKVEAVGNVFFDIGNANFTITAVTQSAGTGAPDLRDAYDSNIVTDDVTNLNNSVPAKRLQFRVTGTINGATVKIYSDGILVGTAGASGSPTDVLTDGLTTLSEGNHTITATQTEIGKTESPLSGGLTINIDTLAPTLTSPSAFEYLEAPQQLVYKFSENVQTNLSIGGNLVLVNTSTSTPVATGDMALSYASDTATITFPLLPSQILSDGKYTATLSGVTDLAGNPLSADVLNFHFLMGDADASETVDSVDFNILAANFGTIGGVNYASADFNYDDAVDTVDFNLLASNFGQFVAAPGASRAISSVAAIPALPAARTTLVGNSDGDRDLLFSDAPVGEML